MVIKMSKILLFLSTGLVYGGIYLQWIGAKSEWLSSFNVSALGALGILILIALKLPSWLCHCYWTPALLLPCFGISVYVLGGATEYVDAQNRLHESLPFLAGGAGFFVIGVAYFILLVLLNLYKLIRRLIA